MSDLEKIGKRLSAATARSADEALQLARAAIEGVGRVNLARAEVVAENGESLLVEIKPTSPVGFLADNTTFTVTARPDGTGTIVLVEVEDYSVYQEKLFFFIPFGPKQVPGSKVYGRCLDAIQAAIA